MERRPRSGGIKKISDLFSVYQKKLHAPEGVVVHACIEVVEDLFSITLTKDQCSFSPRTKTLTLRVGGPLKSEILMQKKEILRHIRGRVPGKGFPEEIL